MAGQHAIDSTVPSTEVMKAELDAAIQWWCDVLRGDPVQDNGDAFQSAFATLVARRASLPTEQQLACFAETLRACIKADEGFLAGACEAMERGVLNWGSSRRMLVCDYQPASLLAQAADVAGISHLRFPIKTIMRIDPGNVRVSRGYGAPMETIYEASGSA